MLNYLKAELYKLLHQRAFCVSLSLLLVLEGMLVTIQRIFETWDMNRSVELLCNGLAIGFFLIYPLSTFVFSEQYKHNTLKNELSFNFPRRRIYLGKFFASAMVCIFTCVVAIGFYLGLTWVFCPGEPGADTGTGLILLGYCLLIAFPLWLGALSLLNMLQFTIKNTTLFSVLYIAYFMMFEPMVWLFANSLTAPSWHDAFYVLHGLQLSTPLNNLSGNLTPILGWAWLVGMGWVLVTTGLGLFLFQKKDIK